MISQELKKVFVFFFIVVVVFTGYYIMSFPHFLCNLAHFRHQQINEMQSILRNMQSPWLRVQNNPYLSYTGPCLDGLLSSQSELCP